MVNIQSMGNLIPKLYRIASFPFTQHVKQPEDMETNITKNTHVITIAVQLLVCFLLWVIGLASIHANPAVHTSPDNTSNLFHSAYQRLHQVWVEGSDELYAPIYSWHNRYKYTRNRINNFNENPWGGGFGKSLYDENGNWHGLFAFAFLDSHKNIEPVVGYAFQKVFHLNQDIEIGGGYTLLVTARPDIFHNIPFPGVLPWVSFGFNRASIAATYIPGSNGVGNVLFLIAKYVFRT